MFDRTIPTFIHALDALSAILKKAEAHCEAKKIDPSIMLSARLFPDMLPFTRQVQIACDHAKGCPARLAGVEVPKYEDNETTFTDLQTRIAKTAAFIGGLQAGQLHGDPARIITLKAGPRELSFPAERYVSDFALPNFYFHMATAYNILRHNGVEIGKGDFLGL